MDDASATISTKAVKAIARKMQAGHEMETTGKVRHWAEFTDAERSLWVRLAKRAATATIAAVGARTSPPSPDKDC